MCSGQLTCWLRRLWSTSDSIPLRLSPQIALLQDEKSVLQAENQKLQKRLQLQQQLPDAGDEAESPEQRQRYKQLIQKLAANNEEIYKVTYRRALMECAVNWHAWRA